MAGQKTSVPWSAAQTEAGPARRNEERRPGANAPWLVPLRAASTEVERERLRVLASLDLVDAPSDPSFDALTSALCIILDVSLSFVVIIDAERTHLKSVCGPFAGPQQAPREQTFCDLVVRGRAPLIIEDAAADPRYADNSFVEGPTGFRFYVGLPLTTSGGAVVGALCGFDSRPRRQPDPARLGTLRSLAASVMSTIELRVSESALRRQEEALRKQSHVLQTVLDSVQQGITAFDDDHRMVAWNRRAAHLMETPVEAFEPAVAQACFPQLRRAMEQISTRTPSEVGSETVEPWGLAVFGDETITAKGRILEMSAVPLEGGGILATYTDVTEERRRSAELRDQSRRFAIQERIASISNEAGGLNDALHRLLALICESTKMPVGRVRHLIDGRIIDLGIERNEIADGSILLPPASFTDAARAVESSRQRYHGEAPVPPGSDGPASLAVYAFPIQILCDFYIFECFGPTQIISKDWHVLVRASMESHLARVAQRERTERLKTEFVSIVSHELQTPLTPVLGMLELLDAGIFGTFSADAQNAISIAYQNSRRLTRIVEDVLELETVRAGRATLVPKIQRIAPLIAEAKTQAGDIVRGRTITLVADPGCEEIEAHVDGPALVQILSKLLSNALKFSTADVVVLSSRTAGRPRISVIDQGAGITPEFRNRLFQQFTQADGSDQRKVDGAGLGLAIVKALSDLLGAAISFDTRENEGTAFHLDLAAPGGASDTQIVTQ